MAEDDGRQNVFVPYYLRKDLKYAQRKTKTQRKVKTQPMVQLVMERHREEQLERYNAQLDAADLAQDCDMDGGETFEPDIEPGVADRSQPLPSIHQMMTKPKPRESPSPPSRTSPPSSSSSSSTLSSSPPPIPSSFDWRDVFECAPVPLMVLDMSGLLMSCNSMFSRFTGYSPDELQGMSIGNITQSEDASYLEHLFSQAAHGDIDSFQVIQRCATKEGRVVPVVLRCFVRRKEREKLVVCSILDLEALSSYINV